MKGTKPMSARAANGRGPPQLHAALTARCRWLGWRQPNLCRLVTHLLTSNCTATTCAVLSLLPHAPRAALHRPPANESVVSSISAISFPSELILMQLAFFTSHEWAACDLGLSFPSAQTGQWPNGTGAVISRVHQQPTSDSLEAYPKLLFRLFQSSPDSSGLRFLDASPDACRSPQSHLVT